jgi:hypothetical protein
MYEVLQPPVSGALLRCPNCQQTFTFGPPTGAERHGAARSLTQPMAPRISTPDFTDSPPLGPSAAPLPTPRDSSFAAWPLPNISLPSAPAATRPEPSAAGDSRPPAAPVINISIPTITNPNARPVSNGKPPDASRSPKVPPDRDGP